MTQFKFLRDSSGGTWILRLADNCVASLDPDSLVEEALYWEPRELFTEEGLTDAE